MVHVKTEIPVNVQPLRPGTTTQCNRLRGSFLPPACRGDVSPAGGMSPLQEEYIPCRRDVYPAGGMLWAYQGLGYANQKCIFLHDQE